MRSVLVLTAPSWSPLEAAEAISRLEATGLKVSDQRAPLVDYVRKEAISGVSRWLESRSLALRRTRYEAQVGSDGDLELSLPRRPFESTDLEVLHDGEALGGVSVIGGARLYRKAGFPSTRAAETFGRLGFYSRRGEVRPEITVRFWAGYEKADLPGDLLRAIWIVFKAWYDRDGRESDTAYEQRTKTAVSFRKPKALPEEAEQILEEYWESFGE